MSQELVVRPYRELHGPEALLLKDREKARQDIAENARSVSTRRAYAHDWRLYEAWCAARNVVPIPASGDDTCAFLSWMEAEGYSLSAIERAYSALALFQRTALAPGWEPPRGYPPKVRDVLKALRRKLGADKHGKNPIIKHELARIVGAIEGDSLSALRDRSLLLLGFWCASRRSELVALNVADVSFAPEGLTLKWRATKTDQDGKGTEKACTVRQDELCPSRALRKWLDASKINEGPIFRGVNRWGTLSVERLTDGSVSKIIKHRCTAVGLDADDFAGHSLRSGFATTAAKAKKGIAPIMKQLGHRDTRSTLVYIRHASLFDDNATEGL
jgi:integrase